MPSFPANIRSNPKYPLLAVVGVALSATAVWYGTGLNPIWWATWLSTLPLLLVAPRLPGWPAFGAAFIAQLIGSLNTWHYLGMLPLSVHMAFMAIPAVALGAGAGLYRRCMLRGSFWQAWLSMPALWIAFEYLYFSASPNGTFGSLAYTQMNCLPVIQLASLAGVWAVGFCPLLFSSTIAVLLGSPASAAAKKGIGCIAAAFLLLAVGFGLWRLHATPTRGTLKVGLVATDAPQYLGAQENEDSLALFRRFVDQVPALASQGARLVILPEHVAAYIDTSLGGNAESVDRMFSGEARRDGVFIAVGVDHVVSPRLLLNQARLYAPDGSVAAVYDKHHLVQGLESPRFTAGTGRSVVVEPSGVWGLAICKDLDFPALAREYGNDGVGLLIVPAFDFGADAWLHARMAMLRGVESGFSIARATNQGLMTVTDDRSRLVAELAPGSAPFATLLVDTPVGHDATLYDRYGDWFAWLDLLLLAAILTAAIGGPRRHEATRVGA